MPPNSQDLHPVDYVDIWLSGLSWSVVSVSVLHNFVYFLFYLVFKL